MAHFGTHPQPSPTPQIPSLDELRSMQDQIAAGIASASKVLNAIRDQATAWDNISDLIHSGVAPWVVEPDEDGNLELKWQSEWAANCKALALTNTITAYSGVEGMERELARLQQQSVMVAQAVDQRSNLVVGVPAGTRVNITDPVNGVSAGVLDPTKRRRPQ